MIISRTPLRISFCGGGTDVQDYWENYEGAVISTSIDKYIYIIVKERYDNEIWLKYSENEIVYDVNDIKHTRWRECLKKVGIDKEIEIEVLKEPIGKQDQYASSHGGFNLIEFKKDRDVIINPIILSPEIKKRLCSNLLLFNTKVTRDAKEILCEQNKKNNIESKKEMLHKMKEFAYSAKDALHSSDLRRFGELLHENWEYKKKMACNLSNSKIDYYYDLAIKAGAIGGKICGAGGGGFLLFYAEPEKQESVRDVLKDLKELEFNFESFGSKIIYIGEK